jgi:hypothetical protein
MVGGCRLLPCLLRYSFALLTALLLEEGDSASTEVEKREDSRISRDTSSPHCQYADSVGRHRDEPIGTGQPPTYNTAV